MVFQHFPQDLGATIEMASHDTMRCMRLFERPPFVTNAGTEKLSGMLVLEALDSLAFRVAKMETDHQVIENAVDKGVDHGTKSRLAAYGVKI